MFGNGLQLLATLEPSLLPMDELADLAALMKARNACEYEHGFLPQLPPAKQVKRWYALVRRIMARALGLDGSALSALLDAYRFPRLAST